MVLATLLGTGGITMWKVSKLYRKNVAAKELSRDPYTDKDMLSSAGIQDWAAGARDYMETMNQDKRAIAMGGDPYLHLWHMVEKPHPEWESYLWTLWSFRQLLHKLTNYSDMLMCNAYPSHWLMEQLDSDSVDVTFVNNWDLNLFEKYGITADAYSAYTKNYSVVDMSDITDGTVNESYDFIDVEMLNLSSAGGRFDHIDAFIDALKPGGHMLVMNASQGKSLYIKSRFHLHSFTDMLRYMKDHTDIERCDHIALDTGWVLLQKKAS